MIVVGYDSLRLCLIHCVLYLKYHELISGDPACEVLKDGCQNLSYLCKHVRKTFDNAVAEYKTSKANDSMDVN